jgi:hypothetical protein
MRQGQPQRIAARKSGGGPAPAPLTHRLALSGLRSPAYRISTVATASGAVPYFTITLGGQPPADALLAE